MQKLIETLSTVSMGQALTGGVTVVALCPCLSKLPR